MNIMELIERLQEIAESNPEAEVRLATQPNYPLQSHLRGVATTHEAIEAERGEEVCDHGYYNCDECAAEAVQENDNIVYLVEGSQVYDDPYAMRALWEVAQ